MTNYQNVEKSAGPTSAVVDVEAAEAVVVDNKTAEVVKDPDMRLYQISAMITFVILGMLLICINVKVVHAEERRERHDEQMAEERSYRTLLIETSCEKSADGYCADAKRLQRLIKMDRDRSEGIVSGLTYKVDLRNAEYFLLMTETARDALKRDSELKKMLKTLMAKLNVTV